VRKWVGLGRRKLLDRIGGLLRARRVRTGESVEISRLSGKSGRRRECKREYSHSKAVAT
jgi:hypothetical protein